MTDHHASSVLSADLFQTIRNSLTLPYCSSRYLKSLVLDVQCSMNYVAYDVYFPDHSIHANEVGKHRLIVTADDSDNLAKVVPQELWITPNSDFFGMRLTLFIIIMWICIVPNSITLFVNVPIHLEMDCIAEDVFSMKIKLSCQLL